MRIRWLFSSVIGFVLLSVGILVIPKPTLLENIAFSQAVYDKQNHLLRLTLAQDGKYRLFTPLDAISPELIQSTLLQEDQYFYFHLGINPWSFFKAAWATYFIQDRRIGASTITMQVARLRFHINSKNLAGKLLQIFRALQLERHYSKNEILQAYLNLAPYGNNIEGVGAASLVYFGKPAHDISLPEALVLAIIPQHPAQRRPIPENLTVLKKIREQLFQRWLKQHPADIDKQALISLPLQLRSINKLPFLAPHFVNNILASSSQQAISTTTLDWQLQKIMERVSNNYIKRKQKLGVNNAAALLIDTRTMTIKALLGSADFFNTAIQGQVDGTRAKRSPGSTLKPFVYALAIDQGLIHPLTVLQDAPRSFGGYDPENFDHDFIGPIPAKNALILSRNIPAIDLAAQLKNPTLYQFLQQAQISHLKPESSYGLSLVLGATELTMRELVQLYAMLVNGGIWQPIRLHAEEIGATNKRLLSREASFLILDILKDTPRPFIINTPTFNKKVPVAWKTGTSSGFRDAWSVASFGPYVLAVWIGNFDAKANPAFIGKDIAAPLLFELIDAIETQAGPLVTIWTDPRHLNLIKTEVCQASGMLPTRYCHDTVPTWFIPGKSPIKTDTVYREVAIDAKTGLRSCHFDKDNKFVVYEFWPSNLLKLFAQAGIKRHTPPPYSPECTLTDITSRGNAPQITSPQSTVTYNIRLNQQQNTLIPFSAITDADVKTLYWFINESFVGKSPRDQSLFWPAKPGTFEVRVVDEQGRSNAQDLRVQVVN